MYRPSENVWQFLLNDIKLTKFLTKLVKLPYPSNCILGHLSLKSKNLYSQQVILGRWQKKKHQKPVPFQTIIAQAISI